ncbi:MAG: type III-A CRISPR-associated protein Cas10/Csm1 [Deltaproteobacteria bacterium]|nr:type III-A CRISPR-associated protein Cas10/Csm1 [Deltaproteobacteria bacterium]
MKEQTVVGALLHDIGKIAQRAKEQLTPEDRGIESTCCPVYKGRYSHQHVLYSGKFIRDHLGDRYAEAEIIALFHHQPEAATLKEEAMMTAVADRLSSGERIKLEEDKESGQPRTSRMQSIFSHLKLNGKAPEPLFFPLLPIQKNLRLHFPDTTNTMGPSENYTNLWTAFKAEAECLSSSEKPSLLIRQLLFLLEKYALFVPSAAYMDIPDISLFHHMKSTAAITTCLLHHELSETDLKEMIAALKSPQLEGALERPLFSLIGADISGIQNFIYDVAARGALKGIRGRSFYIQLLAESIAESILESLGLNAACNIYCSGGHFYLLAPNTDEIHSRLSEHYRNINRILTRAHAGKLSLGLTWIPLAPKDFLGDAFGKAWDRLGTRLGREKRRKAWNILQTTEGRKAVLGPFAVTQKDRACLICGENTPDEESSDERAVCPLCKSFEKLAFRMARGNFLISTPASFENLPKEFETFRDILKHIGWEMDVVEQSDRTKDSYVLNLTAFLSPQKTHMGYRFIGKHTPLTAEGDTATLEDLADRAAGIHKWGALRADVDHLGKVFHEGLQAENRSISRLSMLSHMLSLYFSSHIQFLVHEEPYRRCASLVYSGGDDLFIIGSWSVLPDLARAVYRDFIRFTGDVLRLSAGLYLAPSESYPIYQAAKKAGDEEELAKISGRNRLCVFETPIPWENMDEIEKTRDILCRLVRKGLPRAVFSMLYAGWEEQAQTRKKKASMFRVWKLFYGMARLKERNKPLLADLNSLEHQVVKNLWMPDYTDIAIRWADYLTREKEG